MPFLILADQEQLVNIKLNAELLVSFFAAIHTRAIVFLHFIGCGFAAMFPPQESLPSSLLGTLNRTAGTAEGRGTS